MEDARVGLQASLLVRSPATGELFVNFDPEILTQIREVNCMTRMNLEIPPFAALLQLKQDTLKKNYNKLQVDFTHCLQMHTRERHKEKLIVFNIYCIFVLEIYTMYVTCGSN